MGDGGRLYNGITHSQVELMREMVSVADLTFPNYTEACYLTDTSFHPEGTTWPEACSLLDKLTVLGTHAAVVTSARVDGQTCVIGVQTKGVSTSPAYFRLPYHEIPLSFHGTGDIFSAVLIGHLMNGEALQESTQKAMTVVSRLIDRNRDQEDKCLGIPIEQCLDLL